MPRGRAVVVAVGDGGHLDAGGDRPVVELDPRDAAGRVVAGLDVADEHAVSSRMTRLRIASTVAKSCVAMTTVVPVRLIRSSSWTISRLMPGSRLPVGSSASRIGGRLTKARAMATRCCSPPESWCGKRFSMPASPTRSSTSGTVERIRERGAPSTWRA